MYCIREVVNEHQFNPSKGDWTKHGGIIPYVLVNKFCNFVNTIIKETLNWSDKCNTIKFFCFLFSD